MLYIYIYIYKIKTPIKFYFCNKKKKSMDLLLFAFLGLEEVGDNEAPFCTRFCNFKCSKLEGVCFASLTVMNPA